MYLKYYGFTDKPFEVTPDPKFLYMTPGYQEILSALIYGIHERRGFIAVVGEVGTGKTLMVNAVLDRLDKKQKVALIFNSDLTFKQMLTMVLCDLGMARPEEKLSKVEAIQRLNEFAIKQLERNGNVIIIVDEAQNISDKTMENIRMLSNLETRKHKLVQIVLCGQPELDEKLNRHEWRQLVQRISLKRYAVTLPEEDTYRYLQHRLGVAQYEGPPLFTQGAQELIWKFSEGIPRKINILCDNALLIGYGLGKKEIDEEIIEEAIKDLSWSPYIHAAARQNPSAEASPSKQPEPEKTGIPQEMNPSAEVGADPVAPVSPETRFADGQEAASQPLEVTPSETWEVLQEVPKPGLDRRQSGLIAGVLILVCLIIMAWFFFTKQKVNLGANISLSSHNIIQTEEIGRLKKRAF
jgi:type II secretory pathway predicted ATPase ExeA